MWSAEEDALIKEGYRKLGPQWRLIAASLPAGRSDSSTRNRWNRLQEYENRLQEYAAGVARSSSGSVDGPPAAARSSSGSIDGDKLFEILASTPGVPDVAPLLRAYKEGRIDKKQLYTQLKAQVGVDMLRDALKKMQHA